MRTWSFLELKLLFGKLNNNTVHCIAIWFRMSVKKLIHVPRSKKECCDYMCLGVNCVSIRKWCWRIQWFKCKLNVKCNSSAIWYDELKYDSWEYLVYMYGMLEIDISIAALLNLPRHHHVMLNSCLPVHVYCYV